MAPSTLKHELGGGEYWENEALRAKIDGFGTRYNGDEWYFSREKAASERVLPYFPRTKLGSRTQQTVRALQNLYCSGQPMPWGYLCYHYIV